MQIITLPSIIFSYRLLSKKFVLPRRLYQLLSHDIKKQNLQLCFIKKTSLPLSDPIPSAGKKTLTGVLLSRAAPGVVGICKTPSRGNYYYLHWLALWRIFLHYFELYYLTKGIYFVQYFNMLKKVSFKSLAF